MLSVLFICDSKICLQFQAPARWAVMQAVVSPGVNPLPAEVRLKYHPTDSDSFYGMQQSMWLYEPADLKVYKNSVQAKVRGLFEEIAIMTFSAFEYVHEPTPNLYIPSFRKPHEEMLVDIITAVDTKVRQMLQTENDPAFAAAIKNIRTGKIAQLCLDLTHTFRAGKNWNSHGATVGAATCSIAAILATLKNGSVSPNYEQLGLRGVPLGGARHGSHNTHYVEFMTSQLERKSFLGVAENYLTHGNFRREGHDVKVRQIFDQKLPGIDYPQPRPVRGHTVDFATTYFGTHVLDGECKDAATDAGPAAAILVLHSLQQLSYSDIALALLTTSSTFTLYSSTLNSANGRINTTYTKFSWYVLNHPKVVANDEFAGDTQPAGYYVSNGDKQVHVNVGADTKTRWDSMYSGPQQFLLVVFQCIDVLVEKFEGIDLQTLQQTRAASYAKGFKEPTFWSTREGLIKSKRIPAQNKYKYCSQTMDAAGVGLTDDVIQAQLFESYQFMLDSYKDIISEEVAEALHTGMMLHAPKQ